MAVVPVMAAHALDAGVAISAHSLSGRQVGYAAEIRTSLPFTLGNHFTNALLSGTMGRMMVVARRSRPAVPGL